jgi:hypothetical protein
MDGLRVVVGILFLTSATYMYFAISTSYVDSFNFVRGQLPTNQYQLQKTIDACNSKWADLSNLESSCFKQQVIYYSPWILGILGIIVLIKSRTTAYERKKIGFI